MKVYLASLPHGTLLEASAQRTHRAALVVDSAALARRLMQLLRMLGSNTLHCKDLAEGCEAAKREEMFMMVCNMYQQSLTAEEEAALAKTTVPVVFLVEPQRDNQLLASILQAKARGAGSLATTVGTFTEANFLLTARKIANNDYFGAEKYLRWGSILQRVETIKSSEKADVMQYLADFLDTLPCSEHAATRVLTIAEELLLNAFFDAPVDKEGQRPYASLSREMPVQLPADKYVSLAFGCDGERVVLSCCDRYGSLDVAQILGKLSKALNDSYAEVDFGDGGAGVGLYMAYRFSDDFIVNLAPGEMAEFIAIIDISRITRKAGMRSKSFSIFIKAAD